MSPANIMMCFFIFISSVVLVAGTSSGKVVRGALSVDSKGNIHDESTETSKKQESSVGFDCYAGHSNWRRGWSDKKQKYCCHKHLLGCTDSEAAIVGKRAAQRPPKSVAGVLVDHNGYIKMANRRPAVQKNSTGLAEKSKTSASIVNTPGFGLFGFGYNLLTGNPLQPNSLGADPGFSEAPLFQFDYSDGTMTSDGQYSVPNQVFEVSNPSCSFQQTVSVINSAFAYQNTQSNAFNLGGGYKGVELTFSINAQKIRDTTNSEQNVYATSYIECTSYQFSLNTFQPPQLSSDFVGSVGQLPTDYDNATYAEFISLFGTAFVTEMVVGGRLGYQYTFEYNTFTNLLQNSINIGLQLSYETDFKAGFDHSSSDNTSEQVSNAIQDTSEFTVGGTFSTDITTFAQNVAANAAPVTLSTMPLYNLLAPPYWPNQTAEIQQKMANLQIAINDYCSVLGQQLNIADACTPPPPVPPLQPASVPPNAVLNVCVKNTLNYGLRCTFNVSGPNVAAEMLVPYEMQNMVWHDDTGCVTGNELGAQDGDSIGCSCHVLGMTVGCEGTFPYFSTAQTNGLYTCYGPRSEMVCNVTGTTNQLVT